MHGRVRRVVLALTAVALVAIAGGVTYAVADIAPCGGLAPLAVPTAVIVARSSAKATS